MKLFKDNKALLAQTIALMFMVSACQDKPTDYAPPLSIGGYTSAKQVAPANLVAYWAFNESLVDSVSNTSGTNTGTSFSPGIKGMALQGAINSYVIANTPQVVQNLKSFTVTSWVKTPLNANGIVGLVDISNGTKFWGNLTVFLENGGDATKGLLKIHVDNGKATASDAWLGNYTLTSPWDKWLHTAVSFDEATSTFRVYVNGAKVATQVMAGYGPINFQNASKMVFGTVHFQTNPSLTTATGNQSWASYLQGQLDEVRIYNKALTDTDISSLQRLEAKGK